jgi:hypothetical protein
MDAHKNNELIIFLPAKITYDEDGLFSCSSISQRRGDTMKIKMLQDNVPVYAQVDTESISMRTLQNGEMVEVGKVKKARGKQWVEIIFPDGSHGFIPGETRSFSLIQATINQKKASLYGTAARGPVVAELKKGTLVQFLDTVNANGETWIYIQDAAGHTGYIEGNTKIIRKEKVTKQTGITNMLVGGAFFVVGLIVTIGSYSSASSGGGTYYLCWGAIIFGLIQFIQGLIQFLTAPDK